MALVALTVIWQPDDDLRGLMLLTKKQHGLDIFARSPSDKRLLGMRTEKQLVAHRDTNRLTPHIQPEDPHAATMYRDPSFVKFPLPPAQD